MKLAITLLSIMLLATVAGASTVDFVGYSPYNVDFSGTTVSYQGLDFTGSSNPARYIWCCNSPNAGTAPGLISAFGGYVTLSRTGGGTFSLNSVDMTISWYDGNTSEDISVFDGTNTHTLTLIQGLQTYNLNYSGVSAVTFYDLPSGTGYWFMDNIQYNSTPEPGTLALLGSGALAGIGVLRRKLML